ncbi:hypothetical protein [Streptomyces sp. NPDC059479]|uniref:hypothetical protein n=1 Tax=Streptomyces sp. NPDC059479 TaxID=3346848 RepID=UPI0036CA0919
MAEENAGAAPGPGSGDDPRLLALRAEVEKIITEAQVGARRAQRRAKLWHAVYLSLGFPAAVLAGISGAATPGRTWRPAPASPSRTTPMKARNDCTPPSSPCTNCAPWCRRAR